MLNKFFEFITIGIFTPIVYIFYSVLVILLTFLIGFPIVIGIRLISMALDIFFKGVL